MICTKFDELQSAVAATEAAKAQAGNKSAGVQGVRLAVNAKKKPAQSAASEEG